MWRQLAGVALYSSLNTALALQVELTDERPPQQSVNALPLIRGEISADRPTLVRVHALDMLRDLFGAERSGEKKIWSLDSALQRIATEEHGVLVLVSRNRGTEELLQQIESYPELPQSHGSSSEKGQRFWRVNGTGSQILKDIGVHRMRVMNSPTRYSAISGFNLEIMEFVENT